MGQQLASVGGVLVLVGLLPLLLVALPFILVGQSFRLARGAYLTRQFRRQWGVRGKAAVFVYSDSPNWKEYIETRILPQVGERVLVLNWSRRATWKENPTLEVKMFWHWGGDREFNPMAIVVPPAGSVQTVRFWQAFRDYKHGNSEPLQQCEYELYVAIEVAASRSDGATRLSLLS